MSRLKFLMATLLAPAISYSQAKECPRNFVKSHLEKIGVEVNGKSTRYDLGSDFYDHVKKVAEQRQSQDPQFIERQKKFSEFISVKEKFLENADQLVKLKEEARRLADDVSKASPSEQNTYKTGSRLGVLTEKLDKKRAEIREIESTLGREYTQNKKLGALLQCSLSRRFPLSQHRDELLKSKNYIVRQFGNLRPAYPRAEDCQKLTALENEERKERQNIYNQVREQLLKPLLVSPDGSHFANAVDFYNFGVFDSVETLRQKDGSTLWMLKNKNVLQKAVVISGDINGKKKMEVVFNSAESCVPSVEIISGVGALGEKPLYTQSSLYTEERCAEGPRTKPVADGKEFWDLCYKHFPRPQTIKGAAPSGVR